jgi:hypothetical protein
VSLLETPSQPESMVQEAKLLRRIVEEESDVCNWMREDVSVQNNTDDIYERDSGDRITCPPGFLRHSPGG